MTDQQAAAMTAAIDRLAAIAEAIFHQPDNSELAAVWFIGFLLPMTLYLISHSVGALVNFWRSR